MLENYVLQHIIVDPAGQLAPLKTRHRWNGETVTDNRGRSCFLSVVEDRRTTRARDARTAGTKKGLKEKKGSKKANFYAVKKGSKYLKHKQIHCNYNVFLRVQIAVFNGVHPQKSGKTARI